MPKPWKQQINFGKDWFGISEKNFRVLGCLFFPVTCGWVFAPFWLIDFLSSLWLRRLLLATIGTRITNFFLYLISSAGLIPNIFCYNKCSSRPAPQDLSELNTCFVKMLLVIRILPGLDFLAVLPLKEFHTQDRGIARIS